MCAQAEWQWRQVPAEVGNSLPAKRDMCALLQLQEGQLLLFGGRSEQGKALQDTWLYSVARWVCVGVGGLMCWEACCGERGFHVEHSVGVTSQHAYNTPTK